MSEPKEKAFDKRASAGIELDYPITIDGVEIASLTMRRPKVSDTLWMRKQGSDEFVQGLALMARLCNVTPEHIHELDEIDANKVSEQYEAFRGGSSS